MPSIWAASSSLPLRDGITTEMPAGVSRGSHVFTLRRLGHREALQVVSDAIHLGCQQFPAVARWNHHRDARRCFARIPRIHLTPPGTPREPPGRERCHPSGMPTVPCRCTMESPPRCPPVFREDPTDSPYAAWDAT